MSAYNALNAAIYSKLSGGTALTTLLGGTAVYFAVAPEGAALPYVVWSYQGGGDENLTSNRMKNLLVYIRCYASTHALAGSVDVQADALLHKSTLSVTGWHNIQFMREDDIFTVEQPPDNAPVYSAGGFYRVRLT